MAMASARTQIRFDAVGRAWTLFRQETGVWLLAVVVTGIAAGVINAISFTVSVPLGLMVSAVLGALGSALVSLANFALVVAVNAFFMGNLVRMAIKQVDRQKIAVGDLFVFDAVFPQVLIAWLLYGLLVMVGLCLMIIPAWIAAGVLMFALPLAAEGRRSGIDALRGSWETLKGAWLSATVFHLVLAVIMVSGVLLCGLGSLVTFPLYVLALGVVYRDHFPNKAKGQGGFADDLLPAPPARIPGWAWGVVAVGLCIPVVAMIGLGFGAMAVIQEMTRPGDPRFQAWQPDSAPTRAPDPNGKARQVPPQAKALPQPDIDQLITILNGKGMEKDFTLAMLSMGKPNNVPGQSKVANALVPLLDNPMDRVKAAEALAVWATPEQAPALINALASEDDAVRRAAIKGLARLKDERGLAALAEHLIDPRDRSASSDALVLAGDSARDEVRRYLNHTDPDVRKEAAEILRKIDEAPSADQGAPEGMPALAAMPANPLGGGNPQPPNGPRPTKGANAPERSITRILANLRGNDQAARLSSLDMLARSAPLPRRQGEVAAAISPLLKDADANTRLAAAKSLLGWGTPQEVEPLIDALNEETPGVRKAVVAALGKLKDSRAIAPIASLFLDRAVRPDAIKALTIFGSAAEPEVLKYLQNDDAAVRAAACRTLGAVGTSASIADLDRATHETERTVSTAAKNAVRNINKRGGKANP